MIGFSLYAEKTAHAAATPPAKVSAREIKDIEAFINQIPMGTGADNGPEKFYGAVLVNGKTVAAVYQTGVVALTDEAGAQMEALMRDNADGHGADLARKRLDLIAEALGGTVVMAPLPNGEENATASDLGLSVVVDGRRENAMDAWWQSGAVVEAQILGQRDDPRS